jgi:hypothetical protein
MHAIWKWMWPTKKLLLSLGWTFSWATVGLGLGLQKWNGTERNGTGMLWFKSNGTWWWELKSKAGVSQCTGGSTCRAPIAFLPPAWLFSTTPPPPPSTHFSDRFERGRRPHRRGEERSGGASSMPREDVSLPVAFKICLGKGWFRLVWFGWVLRFRLLPNNRLPTH